MDHDTPGSTPFGTVSLKSHSPAVIFWTSLFVFLYLFQLSILIPAGNVDSDWVWCLGYGASNHFKWGKDFIFTYGPLGYLNSSYLYEQHSLFVKSVIFMLVSKITLLFSLCLCILKADWSLNIFELFAVVFVSAITSQFSRDVVLTLSAIALIAYSWKYKAHPSSLIFAGFLLAFNSLIKETALLESVVVISADCVAKMLFQNGIRKVFLWLPISFITTFVILWKVIGQDYDEIPSFIVGLFYIVEGYENMSALGYASQVVLAICLLVGFLIAVAVAFFEKSTSQIGLFFPTSCALFVAWKEGFNRQDPGFVGHATYFFSFFLAITWLHFSIDSSRNKISPKLFIGLFTICLFCYFTLAPEFFPSINPSAQFATAKQIMILLDKQYYKEEVSSTYSGMASNSFMLPASITSQLEKSPTLMEPMDLLIAPSNHIPIAVPPIPQSYSAYDSYLDQVNTDWLDTKRPSQIILNLAGIDNHYPLDEAPLYNLHILAEYSVKAHNDRYALLKRREKLSGPVRIDWNGLHQNIKVGEWVSVPKTAANVLGVVKFDNLDKTLFGRLMGLMFRVGEMRIVFMLDDGSQRTYRLVVGTARDGLLISHHISSLDEYEKAMEGKMPPNVKAFQIQSTKSSRGEFVSTCDIQFGSLSLEP